jgi:hypothetical protein
MIYNSISVKNILARVYRTFRIDDSDWVYDAVEWAGEALEQIGHIGQYIRKPQVVNIENFNANLPCDLVTLDMVWGEHGRIPYGGSKIEFCNDDYHTGVSNNENQPYYQLEMDKIKCSFESGQVEITYQAYPVDESGFPLIPDVHEYKEAVVWRIISQMLLGGWVPKNSQLNFQYADQKFELFSIRASNRAKFPSPDRMETIRRFFTSIVPDYSQWADGMTGLEQPDQIYIDGHAGNNSGSISNLKKYSYPNQIDNTFGQNTN